MTLLLGVHSWVSGSDVRVLGAATRKEPVPTRRNIMRVYKDAACDRINAVIVCRVVVLQFFSRTRW